jgi:hypothetical protein
MRRSNVTVAAPALLGILVGWEVLAAAGATAAAQDGLPIVPARPAAALERGVLPPDTSEPARARWAKLCAATAREGAGAAASASPRAKSFEFTIQGDQYRGEKEAHAFNARYRFLEPGFVSITFLENGRTRLRGPKGDWLIDGKRVTKLEGREFGEDLRELDEQVALSRTFAGLTEPESLRIVRLEALDRAPLGLPAVLGQELSGLEWLRIESPDLASAREAAAFEARVGLRAESGLPAVALFAQVQEGRPVEQSLQLLRLKDWKPIDGWKVPHHVRSFALDPSRGPSAFAERPSLDLYLDPKGARLTAALGPGDFEPPAR